MKRLPLVDHGPCQACGKRILKPSCGARQWKVCDRVCRAANMRGKRSRAFKTGTYVKDGYRHHLVPASCKKYVREHRIVAEWMIGRKLRKNEVVHHVNGNGLDNRPINLQVMTISAHVTLHKTGQTHTRATKRKLRQIALTQTRHRTPRGQFTSGA